MGRPRSDAPTIAGRATLARGLSFDEQEDFPYVISHFSLPIWTEKSALVIGPF